MALVDSLPTGALGANYSGDPSATPNPPSPNPNTIPNPNPNPDATLTLILSVGAWEHGSTSVITVIEPPALIFRPHDTVLRIPEAQRSYPTLP